MERYLADGERDTSFGSDGKISGNTATEAEVHAAALQRDGKIVVVGTSGTYFDKSFTIWRYYLENSEAR